MAPGLQAPIVSSGAEPPRVEGSGVPPDVGCGNGTRPGPERCQVLPEARWVRALMYHQVPRVFRLVLERVHRHVQVVWHCCSHSQGGTAG